MKTRQTQFGLQLTGIVLPTWPESGPRLNWKIDQLGVGWSSPIIVRDRLYITGDLDDDEARSAPRARFLVRDEPVGVDVERAEAERRGLRKLAREHRARRARSSRRSC